MCSKVLLMVVFQVVEHVIVLLFAQVDSVVKCSSMVQPIPVMSERWQLFAVQGKVVKGLQWL